MQSKTLPDNLTEEESRVLRIVLGFLRNHAEMHVEIRWNRKAPRPQVFQVRRTEINNLAFNVRD